MNLCWILLTTLFTFVELNCENLFDYRHEEGKDDMEWTVTSPRHWNKGRYAGIKATKYKSMIINLPP